MTKINVKQFKTLVAIIGTDRALEENVRSHFNVGSLADIPGEYYKEAQYVLERLAERAKVEQSDESIDELIDLMW